MALSETGARERTTELHAMSGLGWRELAVPLTSRAEWSHSGVAVTHAGSIIVSTPGNGELSIIDRLDGVTTVECGDGIYHGMATDPDRGSNRIWLADIGVVPEAAGLRLYDVDSASLSDESPLSDDTSSVTGWRPTSVAVERSVAHPDGAIVWVADGYGNSRVHRIEAGRVTLTLDGRESGTAFDCPHGIAIDDRDGRNLIVVADRGNKRLVWFRDDGQFVRELRHDLITSPSSLVVVSDRLIVTELFGAIIAVTSHDEVIDLVPRSTRSREGGWPNEGELTNPRRPKLVTGQVNSPHGIASTAHGVVFTEWLIGGRTVHLGNDIVQRPISASY